MIGSLFKKLGPRERFALGVALLCAVALLLDFLVVRPVTGMLDSLDTVIVQEEAALAYARSVVQWEDEVAAEYGQISGRLGQAGSTAETIDAIKGEIDELSRGVDLTINSMSHRDPVQTGFIENYSIELGEFEAEVGALLRFVDAVRRSPGMLRVERLNIVPNRSATSARGSMLISKAMIASGTPAQDAAGVASEE